MWNSGQTAPPAPAWGWPPNLAYQYNQHNADASQNWAAAAALWAQQRSLQGQYQGQNVPQTNYDKPPEPPGPPPMQPSVGLPPLPPLPPLPVDDKEIVVCDYNHGQAPKPVDNVQPFIDNGQKSTTSSGDVFDYHHGKSDIHNEMQPLPGNNVHYNQDWNHQPEHDPKQQWNEWNSNEGNWNDANQWEPTTTNEQFNKRNEFYNNSRGQTEVGYENHLKATNFNKNNAGHKFSTFDSVSSDSSPAGLSEIAKKSKSLPLWLRQGLEKIEKEKKKQTTVDNAADTVNAKFVSGYQHGSSPTSSPERSDKENDEENEVNKKSDEELVEDRSPDVRKKEKKTILKIDSPDEESDNEEDSQLNDEERQKMTIMKIKTWMTDILLGITNGELQSVCEEVYFEMKRSAKSKATQIRKSGGLEALRLAGLGGEGESSSESEAEQENVRKPMFFERQRQISSAKQDVVKFSKIAVPTNPPEIAVAQPPSKQNTKEASKVSDPKHDIIEKRSVEKTKHRSVLKRDKKISSSSNDSDIETKSSSSEDHRRKKKSKRKRSYSRSPPPRKTRKKSSKSSRRRSYSSSDEESKRRSRKKKSSSSSSKKKYYSSEDEDASDASSSSMYRKKSSRKGKKSKHKVARSSSRSPRRSSKKKK